MRGDVAPQRPGHADEPKLRYPSFCFGNNFIVVTIAREFPLSRLRWRFHLHNRLASQYVGLLAQQHTDERAHA